MERAKGDPDCPAIKMNPAACATCPLAVKQPEPPSPLFAHLIYLDGLLQVGAQIPFDYLTMSEWEALVMLKRKRDEKQIADMKVQGRKK